MEINIEIHGSQGFLCSFSERGPCLYICDNKVYTLSFALPVNMHIVKAF